ncbi:MAG: ATP-binding protein [Bifidobacteriaceae bacterium]|nr:ATP-binding protein [Bifidobacteriaceae bacterium]
MANPFTPTFGVTPPFLVGRDHEIAQVKSALDGGPGHPARAVFATGSRGMGKTVLLNALENAARDAGWVVISEAARPGLLAELTATTLPALLASRAGRAARGTVTGVSASVLGFGGSVTREAPTPNAVQPSFRSQLTELAIALGAQGGGVFFTMDEAHRSERSELRTFFQVIQHAFREGLPVAVASAGLPWAVEAVLRDDVLTFLRRAQRWNLGPVPDQLVASALREPIIAAGRSISRPALDLAVATVRGHPFLIQSVGYELWDAVPEKEAIGLAEARAAVPRAARAASRLMHEPILADLSPVERRFARAMADVGTDAVPVDAVARALGVSRGYASKYRARLIAAEVIEPAGRGLVRFAVPLLGEHLRGEP